MIYVDDFASSGALMTNYSLFAVFFFNSASEHLKFTMNFDLQRISFLDTWTLRRDNIVHTDLYAKPTDRNTLLKTDSCHCLPLKNSQPYSQFCRLKRIWTHLTLREQCIVQFKERGYKEQQLDAAVERTNKTPRAALGCPEK